jgi:hypothetical protein
MPLERWVGRVRRECLDRLLIFARRRLEYVLRVDLRHFNEQLHTDHSTCARRIIPEPTRRPQRPSVRCTSGRATCSAVCFTKTKPRREDRVGAPHDVRILILALVAASIIPGGVDFAGSAPPGPRPAPGKGCGDVNHLHDRYLECK